MSGSESPAAPANELRPGVQPAPLPTGEALEPAPPEVGPLDRQLAPVMFLATLIDLGLLAVFLHTTDGVKYSEPGMVSLKTAGIIYLALIVELGFHLWSGARPGRWHWWTLLIPPLRLGARDFGTRRWMWLPGWNWQVVDRGLEKRLLHFFNIPLMCLALLVLPLVLVELFWVEKLAANPHWRGWLDIASAFIWMAFVIEFVLMLSVTPKKGRYVRRNWIDLMIIALPLISLVHAAPVARLLRLNQLTRTARVYRLRGLLMRTWRAIVAFEVIEKMIWRDPQAHLARLEDELAERQTEIADLRHRIHQLQQRIEARKNKPEPPSTPEPPSPAAP